MSVIINGTSGISTDGGSELFGSGSIGGSLTLTSGTANGVTYLNGSKVLTSGSALTFDGTNLGVGITPTTALDVAGPLRSRVIGGVAQLYLNNGATQLSIDNNNAQMVFTTAGGAEQMRLTSTGLGIGTSSPAEKLEVAGNIKLNTTSPDLYFTVSTGTKYNWMVAAQENIDNCFEITPSTTAGGSTFSTPAVVINSSGNVGIGTSSPTDRLTVSGGGIVVNSGNVKVTDGSTTFQMGVNNFATGYGMGTISNSPLIFAANNAERLRIDGTNGLQIGTTAGNSGANGLHVTGTIIQGAAGISQQQLSINSGNTIQSLVLGVGYYPLLLNPLGGNVGIGTSSPVTALTLGTGTTGVCFQSSSATLNSGKIAVIKPSEVGTGNGHLIFETYEGGSGGGERMRITSAGNVGIGTSSPSVRLHVDGDIWMDAAGATRLKITHAGGGEAQIDNPTAALRFATGSTERARIDSSGKLLVAKTSTTGNSNLQVSTTPGGNAGITIASTASGTNYAMLFYTSDGVDHGYISYTTSGTLYSTTSDYRLKENIAPMAGALATVAQLKPCTYTWKADGSAGQGFIAHELQAVVPDCVTGEKDAVDAEGNPKYQGVDTSFLVATLTAALQEQQAIIEQLQADVATLKGTA